MFYFYFYYYCWCWKYDCDMLMSTARGDEECLIGLSTSLPFSPHTTPSFVFNCQNIIPVLLLILFVYMFSVLNYWSAFAVPLLFYYHIMFPINLLLLLLLLFCGQRLHYVFCSLCHNYYCCVPLVYDCNVGFRFSCYVELFLL